MLYIARMDDVLTLPSRYFDTAPGIRLHAKVGGPDGAPTLLLVHGFPEFWFSWRHQLRELMRDYRCVAIDLRGFNLSSQPADVNAYKAAPLIGDLVAVINALGAPVHAVIAHDWGGAVAWSLAAQRPDLLQRLAIINSPHAIPFARALAHDAAQIAASQYMNWLRRPGAETALAVDDYARLLAMLDPMSEAERDAYRACWRQGLTGGCNYYRASPLHPDTPDEPGRAAAVAAALKPDAFRVAVPTQIIWGTGDAALLPVLLDGIDTLVPDLRIHRVEGAGHWVAREQATAVNAVLHRFLADDA
ncbi:MAG: alpha/beta fold hydrolase [Burkholderiales bacterium]|nr:alpha/beta fold hydrolase [Burkholderiales bacterium]